MKCGSLELNRLVSPKRCLNQSDTVICITVYADKKENQIFLIYKEFQNGSVAKSYMTNGILYSIWGNICAFPHILGSPSSYMYCMTLQLLHSEFLIYEENLIFFFISGEP